MINISLRLLQHRQKEWIGIYFENNPAINSIIKTHGAKWSQSNGCWYIPLKEEGYKKMFAALKTVAKVNITGLKLALQKRKEAQLKTGLPPRKSAAFKTTQETNAPNLHTGNKEALQLFIEELKLKAYSPSTIKTYRNEFLQLLQILKQKDVKELTVADIKRYMVFAMEKQGINENTAHSRLNALKFYFEQVLGREKFFWEIPRPKKPQILPKLLNESELAKLFNALTNRKHKAMLFLAYSSGLRVSEIVNLKIADIDSKRMQIFIERAKGKKDRYVNLSPVLLDILRNYIKEYSPRPRIYLFESEQTFTAYPSRTVQQIFYNAKHKAGIRKEIGIHSLRHSFATHLLEKGTDIKYIKDLLGHFNIKTTERYLHVSKQKLINIVSPFDDLWEKEDINW